MTFDEAAMFTIIQVMRIPLFGFFGGYTSYVLCVVDSKFNFQLNHIKHSLKLH